ncbi:MAG: hypothetical protein MJ137_08995 [Clostridia bacterium]|nr:hypothetical protein [Clostridia bacterium]
MSMNKRFYLATLIAAVLTVVLTCAVHPIYIGLVSDVVYAGGILPVIVGIVADILEYGVTALLLATACCSVYVETVDTAPAPKSAKYLHIVILSVPVLRGILTIVSTAVHEGPATLDVSDYLSTSLVVIIDIVIHILAVFVTRYYSKLHILRRLEVRKACRVLGREYDGDHAGAFPFKSFISFRNPVLSGLIYAAIAILAQLVISRLIYDIQLGAPESADELIEIPLGYLEDIVWAFLTYTATFFTSVFYIKKAIETEENEGRE